MRRQILTRQWICQFWLVDVTKGDMMSFFKFDDEKSRKQVAVATLYLSDTKKANEENLARYNLRRSRMVEARIDEEIGEVRVIAA